MRAFRPPARPWGLVAEWLRRGLQILVRGFDSLRGLQKIKELQAFCDIEKIAVSKSSGFRPVAFVPPTIAGLQSQDGGRVVSFAKTTPFDYRRRAGRNLRTR